MKVRKKYRNMVPFYTAQFVNIAMYKRSIKQRKCPLRKKERAMLELVKTNFSKAILKSEKYRLRNSRRVYRESIHTALCENVWDYIDSEFDKIEGK